MLHDFGGKCGRRDRDAPYISSTSRFVLGERHRFNALRSNGKAERVLGVASDNLKAYYQASFLVQLAASGLKLVAGDNRRIRGPATGDVL